jgi:hypothetical protein
MSELQISKSRSVLLFLATVLSSGLFFSTPVRAEEVVSKGVIVKVNPPEREIYIMSEGQKLEYYFNEKTTVTEDGKQGRYEDLKEGQNVSVRAKKIGKRLDPLDVTIEK